MRAGGTLLDGSFPDLRGQLAALASGALSLGQFMDWYFANADTIEFEGSDEEVEILNLVFLLYAEYTSDYIGASDFVDGLLTDPLVQKALAEHKVAVA
jgi:hypothetical protein